MTSRSKFSRRRAAFSRFRSAAAAAASIPATTSFKSRFPNAFVGPGVTASVFATRSISAGADATTDHAPAAGGAGGGPSANRASAGRCGGGDRGVRPPAPTRDAVRGDSSDVGIGASPPPRPFFSSSSRRRFILAGGDASRPPAATISAAAAALAAAAAAACTLRSPSHTTQCQSPRGTSVSPSRQ
eukprot:31129-Pelagococcus_subviridis.AAC.2